MHLPGCFLLTRLFQGHPFYRAAWCRSRVFQVSPLPPPTFTIRLLCTAGTLFFLLLSFLWSKEEIAVCFTKQKPLSRPCHITRDVAWEREMSHPIVLCVHDFVLIACEKTPRTWLSTSQMLTGHFPSHSDSFFYCSFTILQAMKIALQEDGVYPSLFNGCQATLSSWWFGQE